MSTPPMDPYKILGVHKDAQIQDIRQAHRKLVLKCHPDKAQDPELKALKVDEFQKVQQAYEILSDEGQRQKYDDQIRLAELRRQMQNKPNSSAPRASPKMYDFEIRTAEPRSNSYRDAPPPGVKVQYTYSRSSEERSAPRYYEAEPRAPRRGESWSEKPSKRESERDREKREEKERRKRKEQKEKERDREREEERRRDEKAAKKEEKRARERKEAKEKKLGREDKSRRGERDGAYIEPYEDDEILQTKKSSSKKYEEPRERSSGREESRRGYSDVLPTRAEQARAYIHRSRTDTGTERSQSYHARAPQPPAAPTPPPVAPTSFPVPEEEDNRRSSAAPRTRRGSADVPPPRDRNLHRSSREPVAEDPDTAYMSPAAARSSPRYTAGPAPIPMGSSPPRPVRTHTMPAASSRPMGPPRRSQTYSEAPDYSNRGRGRSKLTPQAEVLTDSEDEEEYNEREPPRRSKHRSSRKTRSPEAAQEIRYHVAEGRAKLHSSSSYARELKPERAARYYEAPERSYYEEPVYASAPFPKVKTSKYIDPNDIQYSPHYPLYAENNYGTAKA